MSRAAADVRIFIKGSRDFSSGAPLYGYATGGWLVVDKAFADDINHSMQVREPSTGEVFPLQLEDLLVHEGQHLNGWSHGGVPRTRSPLMAQCGSHGAY